MGKTYKKQSHGYDDEFSSGRSGKHSKHANGRKTGGMKTLNSYVDEEYDLEDDPFHDEIKFEEDITIQHIQNDKS
jgi:hypothetical protein